MTTLPPALVRYRSELRDAVEVDLHRRQSRRRTARRAAKLGVPGVAVATAVTILLTLSGGPGLSAADAAVLNGARAALTPPAGTILHDAADITVGNGAPSHYELWAQADSPQAYRVDKAGHEAAWDGTHSSVYDPSSNTIATGGVVPPNHQPVDLAAALRSLLQNGHASVQGATIIDGVAAYELKVSGLGDGWASGVADGTYFVDRSDYHPLLVRTTADCAGSVCAEVIRFRTYEYLPATASNLARLDLAAQHPGATPSSVPAGQQPVK
jgi:hypothetical protein